MSFTNWDRECVIGSKLGRQDNGEGRKEGGERDFLRWWKLFRLRKSVLEIEDFWRLHVTALFIKCK